MDKFIYIAPINLTEYREIAVNGQSLVQRRMIADIDDGRVKTLNVCKVTKICVFWQYRDARERFTMLCMMTEKSTDAAWTDGPTTLTLLLTLSSSSLSLCIWLLRWHLIEVSYVAVQFLYFQVFYSHYTVALYCIYSGQWT